MQPQAGDHIYGARKGGLYDHHGIYVGNDRVIHMMGPAKQSSSPECQNCGYKQDGRGGLVKTCLNCFLGDHSLCIYEYGVPVSLYNTKPRGTCSMLKSTKPAHEVIQTATDLLERGRNGFGEYGAIANNCEDFAVYCKTGVALSEQVRGRVDNCISVGFPSSFLITAVGIVARSAVMAVGGVGGGFASFGVGMAYSIAKGSRHRGR